MIVNIISFIFRLIVCCMFAFLIFEMIKKIHYLILVKKEQKKQNLDWNNAKYIINMKMRNGGEGNG